MKAVKLSVAAIAALTVTAFAADTDVLKPYGMISGEVGAYGVVDQNKGKLATPLSVKSYSSRFGLTGAHSLAGGLTAVYQVEAGFNPTNDPAGGIGASSLSASAPLTPGSGNNTGLSNRNSFVGLAGGFGTVLIGNHDTPYKLAARGSGAISSADSVADLHLQTDRRLEGAIAYVAPADAVGGATIALAVVPVYNEGNSTDTMNSGFHYSVGVVVPIKDAGLAIGLGYESAYAPIVDDTENSLFAGLNWNNGSFGVGAFFEQVTDGTKLGEGKTTTILVPVTASLGEGLYVNLAAKLVTDDKDKGAAAAADTVGVVGVPGVVREKATQISLQVGKKWGNDFEAYLGAKNSSFKNQVLADKKSATELGIGMKVSFK